MQRNKFLYCASMFVFVVSFPALCTQALSQSAGKSPELQQKVAALKQSVAQNKLALQHYTWTETRQMLLNGDVKSTQAFQCQYGADGKVQKTPVGAPQPAASHERGVRGRIIDKKKAEIKDYMERVASLVKSYVPPSSSKIQQSFQAGKASIQKPGNGLTTLQFRDYAVQGDTVSITFDNAAKTIRSFDVNTYLDNPSDVVTLKVVFETLPDGTNHVAQSVLDATAKQIQIRTTSSGYRKM